ncbi:MAG: class II aldolase/adducin family protein [bacterium]
MTAAQPARKLADHDANRGAIASDEWRVRIDLAACYRLFVRFGWTEVIFTHLSARVPGHADQYLINPYGLLFDEVTASNLIKVDFDGNVIAGDHPYNDAGHAIHSAILRARPEVNAVLHSHTRAGMAVSCMQCGLLPLTQHANEVRELVCYHDYDIATDNETECRRLGRDLGDRWLMIMRNHGLLSAGREVAEAFYLLYMLECACKVQVDVLASGAEPSVVHADALAGMAEYGRPPADGPAPYVAQTWRALLRSLDRQGSSYKE